MPTRAFPSSRLAVFAALAAALLCGPGLVPAAWAAEEPAVDNGAVVIMYHRFGDGRYPSTNITLEQFDAHLEELKKAKYTVMPLPEIVAALRQGEPLPERAVALTVDDAYASFWENAVPRLREAGFPVTLFVATEPVDAGRGSYMSWDQLRELKAMDLATIGSQTHTHPHMPALSPEAIREELRTSQQRFRDELGAPPELIAYPYGEYSKEVQQAAREIGFTAGFGQHSGAIGRTNELFGLPRYAFNESFGDLDRFRLAVNSLPLPVHDVVPDDNKLSPEENPPLYGFTVDEVVGNLGSLSCFASGRGKVPAQTIAGQRVEVRLDRPFPPGRARINCTIPGPNDRWRWFGNQFFVPGEGATDD